MGRSTILLGMLPLCGALFAADSSDTLAFTAEVKSLPSSGPALQVAAKPGQTLKLALRLQNLSGAQLNLSRIDADCGCMIPKYEQVAIEAGSFHDVEISVKAETVARKTAKTVRVYFQQTPLQPYTARFEVSVVGPVRLLSDFASFPPTQREIELVGTIQEPGISVLGCAALRGCLETTDEIVIRENQFVISARRKFDFGTCVEVLRIRYQKDGVIATADLPVKAICENRIRFLPASLTLTGSNELSGATRMVLLKEIDSTISTDNAKILSADGTDYTERFDVSIDRKSSRLFAISCAVDSEWVNRQPLFLQIELADSLESYTCPIHFLGDER